MHSVSSRRCQFCWRAFTTQRAINQHISASKVCLKEWHKNIIRKNTNPDAKRRRFGSPEPILVDDFPNADLPYDLPYVFENTDDQANVEDPDENDQPNKKPKRYVEPYPDPAGQALRREKTRFEIMQDTQRCHGVSPWTPFASRDEWELVEWLMKNVGQRSTDDYLQLPIVSSFF